MKIALYDTDLIDAQWKRINLLLPKTKKRGRKPKDRRQIVNAVLYLTAAGCQWRLLPKDFGPWQTVYHVFRQWAKDGRRQRIHDALRKLVRQEDGRRERPTAAILDSQSVKSAPHRGEVGYDAGKKIKGGKRHILVDTMGLILAVLVTPADIPERTGGLGLFARAGEILNCLKRLWVDGGYTGEEFARELAQHRPKAVVEVVKRSQTAKGFEVLPRRWVVERTFGWLMHQRRLVRDYEESESSAEAFIYIAMIRVQLRRLS